MSTKTDTLEAHAVDAGDVAERHDKVDTDRSFWKIVANVQKFDRAAIERARKFFNLPDDVEPLGWQLQAVAAPYDTVVEEGNLLVRQGLKRLIDRLVETSSVNGINASSPRGRIGVGNSNTAAAATDTDLNASAGSSNRQFNMFDSAPTVGTGASSGVVTIVVTFGTGVANFAWQEWGIDGGTAAGTTVTSDAASTPGLINHKVTSLGTKTSSSSWVLTVTITIT